MALAVIKMPNKYNIKKAGIDNIMNPVKFIYGKLIHLYFWIIGKIIRRYSKKKSGRKSKINLDEYKFNTKETELILYNQAIGKYNNIITRQLRENCYDLFDFEKMPRNPIFNKLPPGYIRKCYGCNKYTRIFHFDYIYSCVSCGNKFMKYRKYITPQIGKVALITGAKSKLGHQVVVKLLRAGAIVIGTTRQPDRMLDIFLKYGERLPLNNLYIYSKEMDFDCDNIRDKLNELSIWISHKFGRLDILINVAAQTIRCRDKNLGLKMDEKNRYGDSKFVRDENINSWQMTLDDLRQNEMEEIFRVNSIAPTLLTQQMLPLLRKSMVMPYIINVHAREGLISVRKSPFHIHTNYGKTCLHMLTRCLYDMDLKTEIGLPFQIHGCCPGFISVDEYYENCRPWIVPPLDEVDGASRILYPLFANLKGKPKTRRHFDMLIH